MDTIYYYTTGLGYTLDQLTKMHNRSFAEYFVPVEMTTETTAVFNRIHQVDLALTVIMHDQDGEYVGMSRTGLRGSRAWCGGFSIVPERRGRGEGKLLIAEVIRIVKQAGCSTFQLEVLTQNTSAIRLYTRAGFANRRRLISMQLPTENLIQHQLDILPVAVPPEYILPGLLQQKRPSWGREIPTILATRSQAVLTSGKHSTGAGLIFQRTPSSTYILATVTYPETTKEELSTLLEAAAGGQGQIEVTNEPEDSIFIECCKELGFRKFISQYEMFHYLD